MIEEMKGRIPGVNIEFYVDTNIITAVYTACGLEPPVTTTTDQGNDNSDEEVIEEFDA